MRLLLAAALAASTMLVSPTRAQAPAQPVPRLGSAELADPGAFANPKLSPDGQRLLARMFTGGARGLAVADLGGNGLDLIGLPADYDLLSYRWAGNGRVLIAMGGQVPFYDRGPQYVSRLFVYDVVTHSLKPVGPKVQGTNGTSVIWVDPDGKELLMASQADQFSYPTVFRADLVTGRTKVEQQPYDNVWSWYADAAGGLRGGIGYQPGGWFTLYRKGNSGGYSRSAQMAYDSGDAAEAMRLVSASDDGYVLSNKSTGRAALHRYNFATGTLGEKVFDSPTNDVDDYDVDEKTGALLWVTYTDDRNRTVWFDPQLKTLQANFEKSFGGRQVTIVSRSRDGARMVVWTGSVTDPGTYYLYERATGALARLAKVADKVDRAGLSDTKYVSYKARDGLDISAYLTLPLARPAKGLPLIVMPHGGPFGVRDTLAYNNEVQFLANRGYAVLQPNYRGSGGYGVAFAERGDGQWGRAMQDDLDDGMDWLAKAGTIDPKRTCIVGSSYGGYAALWGATRNPERYRCAVSFAGVSDLKSQLAYSSDFFVSRKMSSRWKQRVRGDKAFDLDSVSPLRSVAQLKVPVMVAHGDRDATVPVRQTTSYVRALEAAGKPHESYIYAGEGHGFDKAANEKDYLDRLEAFLAKHNPT